jgi:hypothetical protein
MPSGSISVFDADSIWPSAAVPLIVTAPPGGVLVREMTRLLSASSPSALGFPAASEKTPLGTLTTMALTLPAAGATTAL